MNQYRYSGPICKYGTCICNNWTAETVAVSERQAKSNIAYQFKKKYNMYPTANITLPGKIIFVKEVN